MDKIKTQDCYLPVENVSSFRLMVISNEGGELLHRSYLEKHTDMVVLTKEEYLERIKDAMNYMCTPREYLETIFK